METEKMALWALLVVAVMLGTIYAVVVPSEVDAQLGHRITLVKGVSALISGVFFALVAAKYLTLEIPGIELAAGAALLSGSGPSLFLLLVRMSPRAVGRWAANMLGNKGGGGNG